MINLRIHPDQRDLPLPNELGIGEEAIETLRRTLREEGLATVVSGDPGTGKTTLLYSLLRSTGSRLIFTFESPIEMIVEPLIQREYNAIDEIINDRQALVQMLPEIVFGGESMGPESFGALLQFVETGIPTVTTLHERTALWALYRGIRLGGDRFLTKIGLMWCQALVSRPCEGCAERSKPSRAVEYRYGLHRITPPTWTWKRRPGQECDRCGGLGVLGPRRPFVEFFHVTEAARKVARVEPFDRIALRDIVYKHPEEYTIAAQGIKALSAGQIDETDFLRLGDDLL